MLGAPLAGCDYFGEVPRAPYNTEQSLGIVAVWHEGDHVAANWGGFWDPFDPHGHQAFDYAISDPQDLHYAVGAGMDGDGMFYVSMPWYIQAVCQSSSSQFVVDVDSGHTSRFAPDTGAGVGELVPDGLWTAIAFRPASYFDACGGHSLVRLEMRWTVQAQAFSGPEVYYGTGRMHFAP